MNVGQRVTVKNAPGYEDKWEAKFAYEAEQFGKTVVSDDDGELFVVPSGCVSALTNYELADALNRALDAVSHLESVFYGHGHRHVSVNLLESESLLEDLLREVRDGAYDDVVL